VLGETPFLRANLVEGDLALHRRLPRCKAHRVFQNLLELAVFAKGSVNGDEGEIDIGAANRSFVLNVDFRDFAPNERSALATPRPVASETSRSEPGPPINTAIFFELSSSRFLPHDLHFGFQFDSALSARSP
jgi:hypothetical protein